MRLFLIVCLGLAFNEAGAAATEPYGLAAMDQFERLPYLKLDTMAGGQSSYDRSGGNHDYGNFLYADANGKVMLDQEGPGTVYRIWVTGFKAATDVIKVYFDGETTPRINLPLKDMFVGTNAPFLSPLVGNDAVSSGGFYSYLPLPFSKSIKIVASGSFYYNIGYHLYSPDTAITTWTGSEDSRAVRNLWKNAGNDPKSDGGNIAVTNRFDLPGEATQTLLDVAGPDSISSIKLRIPGIEASPPSATITDDGYAHKGYSQFRMTLNPANTGVALVRRLDHGVGNQKADVYVDGTRVGPWFDPGSDHIYHWRDSGFSIPSSYTAGKSSITVKVAFASSDNDWNEFHYWAYSLNTAVSNLTDSLDVGDVGSEAAHSYVISTQTWSGTRTFEYPPAMGVGAVGLLTNLWLAISFDNETNPSVYAPIGSFFAMGQFAPFSVRALPVGMDARTNLYSYFPMPFARRAVVKLVNLSSVLTSNLTCEIRYKPFVDSFAKVGYFKAHFHGETPTTNGADILMLDEEGSGHLVGIVESMMGPINRGYLEGDERIYLDDSLSPAIYGTGTEDFYSAGWYFNRGLFTLPLQGNPAHLADSRFDRTTAYRLFLQDAIPFYKHIRAGIEHGNRNEVSENVWTLAYYYYQPASRARLADELNVGNLSSETAHAYTISNPTWNGTRTNTYDGALDKVTIADDGRAHQGCSQFTLSLPAANAGAILRRRFDQGIANQKADVYVDGSRAGTWYRAGSNNNHRWRDDDFMIPSALTAGKKSVQIKIQFLSANNDWNEFAYSLYALAVMTNATPP